MSELDQQARFEQLVARNRGRLTALARSYAGEDFDDLLQEILLQLWGSLGRFEGRSKIDTWCYRVALNTAISWRRQTARRNKNLAPAEIEVEQLKSSDHGPHECDLLLRFMGTLAEGDRAILLMLLDDMNGADMAEVLGITPGAMRVRVHRLKRRMAEWKADEI